MMSLKMEKLLTQKRKLTFELKNMSARDPQYPFIWDERVEIINQISQLQEEEDGQTNSQSAS